MLWWLLAAMLAGTETVSLCEPVSETSHGPAVRPAVDSRAEIVGESIFVTPL